MTSSVETEQVVFCGMIYKTIIRQKRLQTKEIFKTEQGIIKNNHLLLL